MTTPHDLVNPTPTTSVRPCGSITCHADGLSQASESDEGESGPDRATQTRPYGRANRVGYAAWSYSIEISLPV